MMELDLSVDDAGLQEGSGPYVGRAVEMLVRVDRVDVSRNHRRARPGDAAKQAQLKESLRTDGMLQAVGIAVVGARREIGDRDVLLLMFGARRLAAARALGWDRVPARVFFVESDAKVEALRAVENLHRSDITAVEQAQAVEDIVSLYLDQHPQQKRADAIKYAAAQTGQTESWVRDHDYFVRLTPAVRELALNTSMPAGHLRELAKVGCEADQWKLALEVLGDPPVDEKLGLKLEKNAARSYYEEARALFMEQVEAGTVRYEPIRELRKSIEQTQRKLGRVLWDLSLPVFSTKTKRRLPACVGCDKNSATEPGLFGLDDPPEVKDAACGDAACFAAKGETAERARVALAKRFAKAKAVPTTAEVDKALALGTFAVAGLDAKKARGFVQLEVKKRVSPAKASKKSGGSGGGYGARKLTAHEVALQKYQAAVRAWGQLTLAAIDGAAMKDPARRVAWLLMSCLDAFCGSGLKEIDVPHVSGYSEPVTATPTMPGKLPAKTAGLVELALIGDWASVQALGGSKRARHYDRRVRDSPALFAALGEGWGVEVKEPPAWVDFASRAKTKQGGDGGAEARPAGKQKGGKKKPVAKRKKKPAKKTAKKGPVRKRLSKAERAAWDGGEA